MARADPVYGKSTPLLMAHRGGGREKPESTRMAFDWAKQVGSDVLEIDVHRTLDGQFVVWHGPVLGNVLIEGLPAGGGASLQVSELEWDVLQNAWVADPRENPDHRYTAEEIGAVPRERGRELLLLSDFLQEYSRDAVNIELKGSIKKQHIPSLLELVATHRNDRPILFVSLRQGVLTAIHEHEQENLYPMGLSLLGNLALLSGLEGKKRGQALQTSYAFARTPFIQRARVRDVAFHVFFTRFGPFIPAIDSLPETPSQKDIDKYLHRGIDGIITDRPGRVRTLIDDWVRRNV